jgi:hypothetical protein
LSDVSLSFEVPAATAATLNGPRSSSGRLPPALASLFLLPFAVLLRRCGKGPGRAAFGLLLAVSFATITGLTGCGANNGFYGKGNSSQPTSYTVIVTVATGALSHSTDLTLTVQ